MRSARERKGETALMLGRMEASPRYRSGFCTAIACFAGSIVVGDLILGLTPQGFMLTTAPGPDLINSDFINHRDQLPRHPEEFGALIENRNNRRPDPQSAISRHIVRLKS